MAKIMLVEDDNNLREIYEARLAAEGHEIISAKDGEEALALAIKEKPDLMLCDIMMPKISGFDMLDILRSTEGIKNTKVIMMTALSQAEDKARAAKLGADRYLVKSQVTLEDMAKAVEDVLNGKSESTNPAASELSAPAAAAAPTLPKEEPAAAAPSGHAALASVPSNPAPPAQAAPAAAANTSSVAAASTTSTPVAVPSGPAPAITGLAVPITVTTDDGTNSAAKPEPPAPPAVKPTDSAAPASDNAAAKTLSDSSGAEKAAIQNQINDFIARQATAEPKAATEKAAPASEPAPAAPEEVQPAPAPIMSSSDGVAVTGKKMILPPAADASPKTSLDELLAKEEAKEPVPGATAIADADTPSSTPHPPGHVVTPSEAGKNFDPNGIAL